MFTCASRKRIEIGVHRFILIEKLYATTVGPGNQSISFSLKAGKFSAIVGRDFIKLHGKVFWLINFTFVQTALVEQNHTMIEVACDCRVEQRFQHCTGSRSHSRRSPNPLSIPLFDDAVWLALHDRRRHLVSVCCND